MCSTAVVCDVTCAALSLKSELASYDVASNISPALLAGDVERALAAEAEAILAEVVSRVPPSALMAGADTASGLFAHCVPIHSLQPHTICHLHPAVAPTCHRVLTARA